MRERPPVSLQHCEAGWFDVGPSMAHASECRPRLRPYIDQNGSTLSAHVAYSRYAMWPHRDLHRGLWKYGFPTHVGYSRHAHYKKPISGKPEIGCAGTTQRGWQGVVRTSGLSRARSARFADADSRCPRLTAARLLSGGAVEVRRNCAAAAGGTSRPGRGLAFVRSITFQRERK
jgi:hypothetical protein